MAVLPLITAAMPIVEHPRLIRNAIVLGLTFYSEGL